LNNFESFIRLVDNHVNTTITIESISILRKSSLDAIKNYDNFIIGELAFINDGIGYFFTIVKDEFFDKKIETIKILDHI
jgi:hypothetical protein